MQEVGGVGAKIRFLNREHPLEEGFGGRLVALLGFEQGEAAEVDADFDAVGADLFFGFLDQGLHRALGEGKIALGSLGVGSAAEFSRIRDGAFALPKSARTIQKRTMTSAGSMLSTGIFS